MKDRTHICGMLMGIPPWGMIMSKLTGIILLGPIFLMVQLIGLGIIVTYAIQEHREYKETRKRIKEESDKLVMHKEDISVLPIYAL